MKKVFLVIIVAVCLAAVAFGGFSFYLIDNFESGEFHEGSKWWVFGNLKAELAPTPLVKGKDLIAESCGDYGLKLSGQTKTWYVGGLGTELRLDASSYSRLQLDIYGHQKLAGKLLIELFDDDNFNNKVEQDPQRNYEALYDDRWVAEVNIQGEGFTRISIPFSAFRDGNPAVGDNIWNPVPRDGSGGLLRLQLGAVAGEEVGELDFIVDNILLTY